MLVNITFISKMHMPQHRSRQPEVYRNMQNHGTYHHAQHMLIIHSYPRRYNSNLAQLVSLCSFCRPFVLSILFLVFLQSNSLPRTGTLINENEKILLIRSAGYIYTVDTNVFPRMNKKFRKTRSVGLQHSTTIETQDFCQKGN